MNTYKPSQRYHEVIWMLKHSEDLEMKAKKLSDTSKIIYCCLELRNAIEMLDFHLIIASIPNSEHNLIAEIAKPYHGNDKANNKYKSLKEKTQLFYECVCDVLHVPGKFYDYKKSNKLKFDLSQYIHTYTKTPEEMEFNGTFITAAFPIIKEARNFLNTSLIYDGESYIVQNLDYTTLTPEDKQLLQEWKEDKIDEDTLRKRIITNVNRRRSND
jgi:hypothetical protein